NKKEKLIMELNKIYNEDCLEGMKRIPDGSVDMILCDLPYAQTSNYWDSIIPFEPLWEQYERVIKDNGAIVLTAKGKFLFQLVNNNYGDYRYDWIWNKRKDSNFAHVKKMQLNVNEYADVYYKKTPTYNPIMTEGKPYTQKRKQESVKGIADNLGRHTTISKGLRYPKTIIEVDGIAQRHIIHPTQKPVALFEYLIKTYTNENETVLDNCMGSVTTAVACLNTNRNYIGFELDEEYYNASLDRIGKHKEE